MSFCNAYRNHLRHDGAGANRITMDLHLTDEQLELLVTTLDRIIDGDRYPLSRRIPALREIRAVLKPYPERPPPAPPQKPYEPPTRGQYRRRR